jgi:hypothetical protein
MVSLSRRDVEALRRNGSARGRTTLVVDTRALVAPSRSIGIKPKPLFVPIKPVRRAKQSVERSWRT